MEEKSVPLSPTPLPRVTVIARHSADCSHRKDPNFRKCTCRKSLVVYRDGHTIRVSAKTRSWEKAEDFAREYRDGFDPEKQELKRLRAQEKAKQMPLPEAISLYYSDMVARLGDNGTVSMARSLFGHIDAETKAVERNGHFFDWLDRQKPRPMYVADITPSHLTEWRASWKFGDLTAAQRWGMVRGFFSFCESQGWIEDSPARKLKPLRAQRGNRTAIFTDDQYTAILKAVAELEPAENLPAQTRRSWRERLHAFVELLRWSGMDLADAAQWRPELLDEAGVLRYRRTKTDVLATVALPDHLLTLLKNLPLERDSVGPDQPFRTKDTDVQSDARKWAYRLTALFAAAGIKKVTTEIGRQRAPHPKMLRDTFAVYALRHGAKIHTVSKMLGHSKTAMTESAYLPWVKELEAAHIDDARKYLAAIPKSGKPGKVLTLKKA